MSTLSAPGRAIGLTKRQHYNQLVSQMELERSSFDTENEELARHLAPRRFRRSTSDRNKGDRRTEAIIDSAPRQSVTTLGAGMHSGMTSPSKPWFRLTTPDSSLAEFGSVKAWLHTVTQRLLTIFLRSNLYTALPVVYEDIGVFGTAAVALMEDPKDILRAYTYPCGSYALGLDARQVATSFMRTYQLTVRQVIEQFALVEGTRDVDWSKVSITVKNLWNEGNELAPVDVVWLITPNDEYDPTRLQAKYRHRWASCWFERGRQDADFSDPNTFLRESGYRFFPILAPRWSVTGEDTYGTDCPGRRALGDVKSLQFMARKMAKAVDKAIDPPLKATTAIKTQQVSLLPARITWVPDLEKNTTGVAPIHEVRLEGIEQLREERADIRQRVREAFYTDLFLMLAAADRRQPITAEEVRARLEEKYNSLAPVYERLNDDLLDPAIDRAFDIALEAGAIPPPPAELEGVDLKVEYLSLMAQVFKQQGTAGQERFLMYVGQMAQFWPDVLHKVEPFQNVDSFADKLGIDPNLVRTDEDAQASVERAQQLAAAQQQAELLKTSAQAAQMLGKTPTQGGSSTALQDVLGAA